MRLNDIMGDDDDFDPFDDSDAYSDADEDFEVRGNQQTVDPKILNPSYLYDHPELFTYSQAFIFIPPKTLVMGMDTTHTQLALQLTHKVAANPQASKQEKLLAQAAKYAALGSLTKFPYATGRIVYDLTPSNLADRSLVSYYSHRNTTPDVLKASLAFLQSKGHIDPDTIIVFGQQVLNNNEVDAAREHTPEEIRKGQLQVMLHLGATPDGKRLTQQQKNAIRKELGIGTPANANPWNVAGEKAGITVPGQKMWAMHSEGLTYPLPLE